MNISAVYEVSKCGDDFVAELFLPEMLMPPQKKLKKKKYSIFVSYGYWPLKFNNYIQDDVTEKILIFLETTVSVDKVTQRNW